MSKTMKKGIIAAAVALCLAISCVLMKAPEKLPAFAETDGQVRCLFFDALEMMDHCVFLEEGETP